jgi:hypothetical protein
MSRNPVWILFAKALDRKAKPKLKVRGLNSKVRPAILALFRRKQAGYTLAVAKL